MTGGSTAFWSSSLWVSQMLRCGPTSNMLSLQKRVRTLLVSYETSWEKWGKCPQYHVHASERQLGSCWWCTFIYAAIKLCSTWGQAGSRGAWAPLGAAGKSFVLHAKRPVLVEPAELWNLGFLFEAETWKQTSREEAMQPFFGFGFGFLFLFFFKLCKLSTVCSQLQIKSSR